MGARFYRQAMMQTRIGLESWELPEPIRHALEGFIGNRIDGASLAYARELVAKIWAMRAEIEALARSGASPRRVCAFVAGRLSGKPDRSRREVLRRTAELIRESLDLELIERRITGLRRFVAEREAEFQAGQICRRCGYRHTQIEYETGYRDDGTGELSLLWLGTDQARGAPRGSQDRGAPTAGAPLPPLRGIAARGPRRGVVLELLPPPSENLSALGPTVGCRRVRGGLLYSS
jgi:hypothetical protein